MRLTWLQAIDRTRGALGRGGGKSSRGLALNGYRQRRVSGAMQASTAAAGGTGYSESTNLFADGSRHRGVLADNCSLLVSRR